MLAAARHGHGQGSRATQPSPHTWDSFWYVSSMVLPFPALLASIKGALAAFALPPCRGQGVQERQAGGGRKGAVAGFPRWLARSAAQP